MIPSSETAHELVGEAQRFNAAARRVSTAYGLPSPREWWERQGEERTRLTLHPYMVASATSGPLLKGEWASQQPANMQRALTTA